MTKRTTNFDLSRTTFRMNDAATGEVSRYRCVHHYMVEDHSQMVRDVEGDYPAYYMTDGVEGCRTKEAEFAVALLIFSDGTVERIGDLEVTCTIKAMPYHIGVYFLSEDLTQLYITTSEDEYTDVMVRGGDESKKAWLGRLKSFTLGLKMAKA